jgi:hypothetical protein
LLATADVDDMSSLLNCLLDGAGKVKLREVTLLKVTKDWSYYPLTLRRDATYWTARLTKDDACDVRPVNRHRAVASGLLNQGIQPPDSGSTKTGMREIHRAIKNGHAYLGLAERSILQRL